MNIASTLAMALASSSANEVTVYNQSFAFVKEVRQFNLKQGRQTLSVSDVASQIETNSVGIKSLTAPGSLEVLEQNYQYDLINTLSILNKAVGSKVKLHRVLPDGKKEIVEGTLMSSPSAISSDPDGNIRQTENGLVIQTDDGRILLDPSGEIEVASIPEGMISKPTLIWDLIANKPGQNAIELSYITKGLTWNADYVLTLDGLGKADLRGWVTMVNNSGTTYKDAKLKLLAGDVNRAENRRRGVMQLPKAVLSEMDSKKGFEEEALFEYHLYTLQRPSTLKDKEIKQLSLLEGHGVKVEKKLIIDSMRDFGVYYPSEGEVGTGNLKAQVRVELANSKENGLGMPMPKGTVKVYQRDKSGSVQMLGEDLIDHTPKNERISLVVGRAFDVVGERKRLSFQRVSKRSCRETFHIKVTNRKETPETVTVIERHYGDWTIEKESMKSQKLDANSMSYTVQLKPDESKEITYTVFTKW